jgi:hypothetical protein
LFLAFAQKQFDRLRQSLMAPGQAVEAFVNRHEIPLRLRRADQLHSSDFIIEGLGSPSGTKIKPTHCAV